MVEGGRGEAGGSPWRFTRPYVEDATGGTMMEVSVCNIKGLGWEFVFFLGMVVLLDCRYVGVVSAMAVILRHWTTLLGV